MDILEIAQGLIPQKLKIYLKPYLRKVLPNKRFAVLWITFRCNYKCSYCPYESTSDYSKIFPIDCELTKEEWLKNLEKLPPTSFYFSGGEPFLYSDLAYIINNFPSKHSILGVISNGSLPLSVYKKVKKKIHLNISFHREFVDEESFIDKVKELSKLFQVSINIVATPENIPFLDTLSKICKENKIHFHVDPLVTNGFVCYEYNDKQKFILKKYIKTDRSNTKKMLFAQKTAKICSAGRNFYNIMPNGEVSVCSRMMDNKYSNYGEKIDESNFFLENIFSENFKLNTQNIICKHACINHCDLDYCDIKPITSK